MSSLYTWFRSVWVCDREMLGTAWSEHYEALIMTVLSITCAVQHQHFVNLLCDNSRVAITWTTSLGSAACVMLSKMLSVIATCSSEVCLVVCNNGIRQTSGSKGRQPLHNRRCCQMCASIAVKCVPALHVAEGQLHPDLSVCNTSARSLCSNPTSCIYLLSSLVCFASSSDI